MLRIITAGFAVKGLVRDLTKGFIQTGYYRIPAKILDIIDMTFYISIEDIDLLSNRYTSGLQRFDFDLPKVRFD